MMELNSMFTISTAAILVSVVGLAQLLLLYRILRAARSWRHIEERVTHFGKVLTLLTETTEAGFNAMAAEVRRQTEAKSATSSRRATGHPAAADVRRSWPTSEIEIDEQVTEGESSLRRYLESREHALACPCTTCATEAASVEVSA